MTTDKKREFLIKVAYAAVIILLIYFVLKYAVNWIMPFIVAFIFSAILYPLIKLLSEKLKLTKHIRPIAVVITALFYCTVGVLTWFIISRIVVAVTGFITSLPEYFATTIKPNLEIAYEKVIGLLANLKIEVDTGSKTFFDSLYSSLSGVVSKLMPSLSFITSIPGMIVSVIIMIISTFFISMDFEKITGFCMAQLPKKTADFISELKDYTVKILFKYIRSYALILGITFVELLIGFIVMHFITGQQNIFLLALLIALLDILPIVGTGTVLIPWTVISLIVGDYAKAICLIIMYVVITVIRQFIEPKIVGDQVGLHPVATLIAMIVGTKLFGAVGLFGLPITLAIIKDLNDHGKIHVFKPYTPPVKEKAEKPEKTEKKKKKKDKTTEKSEEKTEEPPDDNKTDGTDETDSIE